jgi:predicted house-cleaning noncanonical NTP pyrophosphatase (MazG superfamily)
MSGTGAKPKSQAAPPPKGKVPIVRQTRTTDPETQERGKTRASGTVEIDEDVQEIGDSEKGRSYLEDRLLLVPAGASLTLDALATALCQIAALPGVTLPVVNAVRAVAFLLKDVELGVVAEDIRDIANAQFNELATDLREFTEGLRIKVMEELEKKMEVLTEKTAELAEVVEKAAQQAGNAASSPYRDALTRAVSGAPMDANPRLAAKENIRQRQSLIDLPKGSTLSDCANSVLVSKFAEAMGRATRQQHKIRSALKLQNGGILVEMVTDVGAAWLASKANAEAFL